MATIGENIRKFRKDKGISQKELSEKSNINVSQLSRYENNKSKPTMDSIIKIANALEVDIRDITCKEYPTESLFNSTEIEIIKTSLKIVECIYYLTDCTGEYQYDRIKRIEKKLEEYYE